MSSFPPLMIGFILVVEILDTKEKKKKNQDIFASNLNPNCFLSSYSKIKHRQTYIQSSCSFACSRVSNVDIGG